MDGQDGREYPAGYLDRVELMENLLFPKVRMEIALELGESYYREFKSAFQGAPNNKQPRELKEIFADVAKTLVAFANADGGELFIGV